MKQTLLAMLMAVSLLPVSALSSVGSDAPKEGLFVRSDETLDSIYANSTAARIMSASVTARVKYYANIFLAKKSPYVVEPLGEGENGEFNKGPLYRFDGFDCTTFVETVLALSLSSTPEQFKQTINKIRYKNGEVSYQTRNHFPSVDWIPNNTQAGFVEDITGKVGGEKTRWSQTWIEKDNWFRMKGPDFFQLSTEFGKELGKIPYLSKEDLLNNRALENRIPSGAIFHVVRPNWDLKKAIGTELDVSHEGFLIRENGVLYMVHASNGLRDGGEDYKGVKKEALREYISRVMMKSPSMAGFNILRIQAH
ncbi:N-acetylmuramoyl-L-alanine amidase-like domain-containing protein [Bdellovibrio sp. HCB-162]|uniref:N-acetylmuramoyl-L-alanine amidase-like domain-containing protein n=1 Tax=Bdellovibrio sp. HCB-162 TaxID=3394234 RepID=UPI0039BD1B74